MSQSTHADCYVYHLKPHLDHSTPKSDFDIPKLKTHFFYSSSLPIDDPLSIVPSTSGADFKSIKHPLRPFSAEDSEALERAWHSLVPGCVNIHTSEGQNLISNPEGVHSKTDGSVLMGTSKDRSTISTLKTSSVNGVDTSLELSHSEFSDSIYSGHEKESTEVQKTISTTNTKICDSKITQAQTLASCYKHTQGHKENDIEILSKGNNLNQNDTLMLKKNVTHQDSLHCAQHLGSQTPGLKQSYFEDQKNDCLTLSQDQNKGEQGEQNDGMISKRFKKMSQDNLEYHKVERRDRLGRVSSSTQASLVHVSDGRMRDLFPSYTFDANNSREFSRQSAPESRMNSDSHFSKLDLDHDLFEKTRIAAEIHNFKNEDTGTTGRPFLKLPSRPCSSFRNDQNIDTYDGKSNKSDVLSAEDFYKDSAYRTGILSAKEFDTSQFSKCKPKSSIDKSFDVPVGISRLHLVRLPNLQMKPIYWSPVNDTASVTRGTWFYQETMYPVEPSVANQLEFGYRELQPWSQTWKDELESALSVGAAGEEKIAYRLWPNERDNLLNKDYTQFRMKIFSDLYCAAEYFQGEIAVEGTTDFEVGDKELPEPKTDFKKYSTAQIIYKDSRHAFILKPNLQPSAYFRRKPLQKINKGITVGIAVVRGFEWETWDKLHPTKKLSAAYHGDYPTLARDVNFSTSNPFACDPTLKNRSRATDLVLIVHGIGQKLSERVESFNFTHAVNEFRRSINVEMCNNSVRRVLRKDGVGIMVLPVNWRANLSFEDGGLMKDGDFDRQKMDYSLSDVTQESLPLVRQMISDVMLDIPYYMSKHKPKMIQAVVQEANRVYRLWCKNNQNFEKEGRVHLIAHSLGSVMVLEILSKQPNFVPELDLSSTKVNTEHFEFKTTNCFFAGSPAGFFLLLEQGKLSPRRGLHKPDAEHFNDKTVTGEAGTFGCMALENIYNVMHYNDPIAYRLNATVDRKYAEYLKEAQLPSTTMGLFESIGRAMRSLTPGIAPPQEIPLDKTLNQLSIKHLPSNMEMEVHDFSREENAEKKLNLLNDNGQIDWYMNSGRGPLEIQYLNMLGAHSSYWANSDFVRMVVLECGRKPGKNNTIPSMRAMKVTRIGRR